MMKNVVIIVAGGSGKRMNSAIPKQFLLLNNLPVLMHTIHIFHVFDKTIEIIVVLPEEQINNWKSLCKEHQFTIDHKLVPGGKTRFHSSRNAIEMLTGDCLVAIHDGVRPLVSLNTIDRCFKAAEKNGAAIPVINLVDSIRRVNNSDNFPANRNEIVLCQTPQVFQSNLLIEAFKQPYSSKFTDDALVVEKLGHEISLVEGNRENIKITNQVDLAVAERLLKYLQENP